MNALHDPRTGDTMIDLSSSFDRIYWRTRFATTDRGLSRAVQEVGPRVEDVKAYFGIGGAIPQGEPETKRELPAA